MQNLLFSIIVSCNNQEDMIETFLESLLQQTYRHIEVIFVDNASEDRSYEIAVSHIKQFVDEGMNLTVIRNKRCLDAMNCRAIGTREREGGLVYYTNPRISIPRNFIETIVNCFSSDQNIGVVLVRKPADKPKPTVVEDILNQFDLHESQIIYRTIIRQTVGRHMLTFLRYQDIYTVFLMACISNIVYCDDLMVDATDYSVPLLTGKQEDLLYMTERYAILLACVEKARVFHRYEFVPVIQKCIRKLPSQCQQIAIQAHSFGYSDLSKRFEAMADAFFYACDEQ